MKTCVRCGEAKPETAFRKAGSGHRMNACGACTDGRKGACPDCGVVQTRDKANVRTGNVNWSCDECRVYDRGCRKLHGPPTPKAAACKGCGETFYRPFRNTSRMVYCSKRCAKRAKKPAERARRRAIRGTTIQTISRWELWDHWHGHCYWCEEWVEYEDSTIEHLVPIASGGHHTKDNVVMACMPCNARRGHTDVEAWTTYITEGGTRPSRPRKNRGELAAA